MVEKGKDGKMSRIGKQPIEIPKEVTVSLEGQKVSLKGPRGELKYEVPGELQVIREDADLVVKPRDVLSPRVKAKWGLWRSLLANAVVGVTQGYQKQLELHGVGYRGQKKDGGLELQLGYSHPVTYFPPEGVEVSIEKNVITVKGIDKQQVGQVAAQIRALRPPDPYKGKGVRYRGEVLHLKPGKAARATGGE